MLLYPCLLLGLTCYPQKQLLLGTQLLLPLEVD